MGTTQAVEVEADLLLEAWNQQWLIQGNDVLCRRCHKRQRLVGAHEVFIHSRACMWHVLKKKHYSPLGWAHILLTGEYLWPKP
ncbi:hypothetical protein ALQ42_200148 [Pseudomonas savastanoi pv. glycinea]|uniref:Uncharacterized protein n=1 Tax=Pseudomonas savastanoi pv. glycinea TaxID=318 RepID=A0A3M3V8A8_PSESG|nr:hypothetical protein ALQ42_200148 [Pseudomonas savastanoi pv. glycinea]RMU47727.1 hypothetical protein ALP27_200202 [Pseudomonas savastanoi pv. glycinea]